MFDGSRERLSAGDGHSERTPHRAAQRFPSERIGRPLRRDDARGAAPFRRPDDGPHVSRILNVCEQDDELRRRGEYIFDVSPGPCGERHDAGGLAHRAHRIEHLRRHRDDERVGSASGVGERRQASVESVFGERRHLQRRTSGQRIVEEMFAIEQNPIRNVAARDVTEPGDERILPARDTLHQRDCICQIPELEETGRDFTTARAERIATKKLRRSSSYRVVNVAAMRSAISAYVLPSPR